MRERLITVAQVEPPSTCASIAARAGASQRDPTGVAFRKWSETRLSETRPGLLFRSSRADRDPTGVDSQSETRPVMVDSPKWSASRRSETRPSETSESRPGCLSEVERRPCATPAARASADAPTGDRPATGRSFMRYALEAPTRDRPVVHALSGAMRSWSRHLDGGYLSPRDSRDWCVLTRQRASVGGRRAPRRAPARRSKRAT